MTRLAILASIGVMLAVTLLPTLRSYLRQQGEIATLREQVVEQTAEVAALVRERRQWNDPAYVEQQARQRLKMVRPGETSYSVLDAEPAGGAAAPPGTLQALQATSSWYDRVWQSMVLADTAPSQRR